MPGTRSLEGRLVAAEHVCRKTAGPRGASRFARELLIAGAA